MPWKTGSFFWTCYLFTNLEKMRSHGDDLVVVVGIGGLGIILLSTSRHRSASYMRLGHLIPGGQYKLQNSGSTWLGSKGQMGSFLLSMA